MDTAKLEIIYETPPSGIPCKTVILGDGYIHIRRIFDLAHGYTRAYCYSVGSCTYLALLKTDKVIS